VIEVCTSAWVAPVWVARELAPAVWAVQAITATEVRARALIRRARRARGAGLDLVMAVAFLFQWFRDLDRGWPRCRSCGRPWCWFVLLTVTRK
jgi:hypothetical protein